jgi:hypothetical protein
MANGLCPTGIRSRTQRLITGALLAACKRRLRRFSSHILSYFGFGSILFVETPKQFSSNPLDEPPEGHGNSARAKTRTGF